MTPGKRERQAPAARPGVGFWAALTLLCVTFSTAGLIWLLRCFGLEAVLIAFVTGSGTCWGWTIRWLWKDGRITLSHILVIWMVWTGTILGGASYYLAYRGLTSDLETLSRYVMVEVVAGIGGYFVKSGVENVLKSKQNGGSTKVAADVVDLISASQPK